MQRRIRTSTICAYGLLFLMAIVVLFPLCWTFLTSIKTDVQMFAIPPVWIPKPPTFRNYISVFMEGDFRYFIRNSVIVSIMSTLISMLIAAPAAYSLAKYKRSYNQFLLKAIVTIRMLPPIILCIPFFLMMRSWGLINTKLGLIITYLPLELTLIIWILEGAFREVPKEIEEAAAIDGLGIMGIFLRIAVPLTIPTIAVASVFGFLTAWNEFIFALTLTRSSVSQTLPVGVAGYVTSFQIYWGKMSATAILYILPALIFTILAQKGLIKGLTVGAVKA